MFVANVTPVMLIASVAVYNGQAFTAIDTALLIQAAMLIAGIGTLIQLYPVWRIGSRLPVVMGLSFTFLSAMMTLDAKDYGLMIGAVIVGGCIEGLLGLTAKYWRRFVSPIVSACVVTTIGFSLLSTGISSFASSSVYPTGAWQNLLRGRVRGRDDPVSGSAQACQDGGRRRADRGHHRKQKTGITKSKTAGASRRTGCSCFACREVGFL